MQHLMVEMEECQALVVVLLHTEDLVVECILLDTHRELVELVLLEMDELLELVEFRELVVDEQVDM